MYLVWYIWLVDKVKTVTAKFYRTASGRLPVREWLQGLSKEDRIAIGRDIAKCEFQWPVGPPTCKHLRDGLHEVRTDLSGTRIARVFFAIGGGIMLLLHGIIKKTQKTPKQDIDLALKRKKQAERK